MQRTNTIEYIVRGDMPDLELVRANCHREIRKSEMAMPITPQRRALRTAIIAIAVITLVSTTAFAAWYFLSPGEVASEFGNQLLSAAFDSESAVNINSSVTSGDYIFTLLAVVTGRHITDMPYYSPDVQLDRTYAVVAIQNTDGTSIQDDPNERDIFFTSPLVKGLDPSQFNVTTMGGRYSDTVVDGVLYRIVECDGIAIFADRGLYFAVSTNDHPSAVNTDAFIVDGQTGVIKANPDFLGASAVFELPLDTSMADSERAAWYLALDPDSRDKDETLIAEPPMPLPLLEIDETAWEYAFSFYDAVLLYTGEVIQDYPITADMDRHIVPDTNEEIAIWIFRTTDDTYNYYGHVDINSGMVTTLLVTDISASLGSPVTEHTYGSGHEEAASQIVDKIGSGFTMSYWGHGNIAQNSVVKFAFEKEGITYLVSIDKDSYRFVGIEYYPYALDTAARG